MKKWDEHMENNKNIKRSLEESSSLAIDLVETSLDKIADVEILK